MPYIRRPEEPIRFSLDHLLLGTFWGRTPDCQTAILVMIVEEHHKASLPVDEERGTAVAGSFGSLGQLQRRCPDHLKGSFRIARVIARHGSILPARKSRAGLISSVD
jgi:hypothetical protein